MILFFLLLFGVFTLSGAIVFWMELSITNDRVIWLQERLTKLEKDAVKVTFTGEPNLIVHSDVAFHPKPKTQTDYQNEHAKPLSKKRKPKTVKEWEDKFDLGGHE
jgi:hypothetical protein